MAAGAEARDVIDLLSRVWTWFGGTHEIASRRGLRWDRASTPFVHRERGRVVSHVGVLELPLVVRGTALRVAGVHAVATEPESRGRGLMRGVMERALAFVDDRWPTAVLTAAEPGIYRRFGFEVVPECRFLGPAPAVGTAGAAPLRDLDPESPADLAILHRLLRDRTAQSRVLGVGRESAVFLFDSATARLRYAEDLDAIVWAWIRDDSLVITDLLAERIPTLAEISARVPEPFERVEVHFAPDRLGVELAAEPWLFDGDEVLMARGPFLPPDAEACLPRGARC